jgi:hypothetical protein
MTGNKSIIHGFLRTLPQTLPAQLPVLVFSFHGLLACLPPVNIDLNA